MRLLWDNNVLDRVHDLAPEDRTRLARCLQRRRHSLYVSPDGLEETLGLLRTVRQERLMQMMAWYPGMISRILAPFGLIIQSELRLERKAFAEASMEKRLRELLDALQRGEKPDSLVGELEKVTRKTTEHHTWFRGIQTKFRTYAKGLERPSMTFEEFLAREQNLEMDRESIAKTLTRMNGAAIPAGADDVIRRPATFRYLHTMLRSYSARAYWGLVMDRKAKEGDQRDDHQLIYLTDLDAFVTEDRDLREVARLVFGDKKKILSFDEFLVTLR